MSKELRDNLKVSNWLKMTQLSNLKSVSLQNTRKSVLSQTYWNKPLMPGINYTQEAEASGSLLV